MPHEVKSFQHALSASKFSECIDMLYMPSRLDESTVAFSRGAEVLCLFVTDTVDAMILRKLKNNGVRFLVLRCPGHASVDVRRSIEHSVRVARTPHHAPVSIAEYAVSLILALNRKIHVAHHRARNGNMTHQGLLGFEMRGKTVGIIGTGKVGRVTAQIVRGFGCNVLAYDVVQVDEIRAMGGRYVELTQLFSNSDIIVLHAPLLPATRHLISDEAISRCKRGVMFINTSRGGLMDMAAMIEALRSGQVGALGMDVYEGETGLFYKDNTGEMVDPEFLVLQSMPNVIITGHQSSLTSSAVQDIANWAVQTLELYYAGEPIKHEVLSARLPPQEQAGLGQPSSDGDWAGGV